jgi:uncharacterized protein (DUF1501 family)
MRLDRRRFLLGTVAAGGVLAFHRWLRAEDAPGATRRTVVLLHLAGGNDGLNTVVPHADPIYRRLRPTIGLAPDGVVRLADGLALHPSLAPLEPLLSRGTLVVVNGVGYPRPDFSHFRATEIWHTAEPDSAPRFGWLGRSFDARAGAPLKGVALAKELPLCLHSEAPASATVTDFARFRLPDGLSSVASLYESAGDAAGPRGEVGRAGRRALDTARVIASLSPAEAPYPQGPLGEDLKRVEALLAADLDLEAIALSFGGFDTHANQQGTHAQLLATLARCLVVFQGRLEQRGLARRTVVLVFSEFGRRPEENASGGTDHGSAGPVFVMGAGLRGGLLGAPPSLADLDEGNLRFTTDFRRVYASLLAGALDLDPAPFLGDFAPLEIFA